MRGAPSPMLILIAVKPKPSADLIRVAGVVFTRVPVLSGDTASSLGPVWLSRGGKGFGKSGQRRVTGVWRDYNESCQLECSLVAICSAHEKKSDL